MLHLFKKVYIEFDTKISIDYDRIVISETCGVPMLDVLDKVSYGELIAHGHTLEDVVGEGAVYSTLLDMLTNLSTRVDSTDTTTIIFADEQTFIKIVATWFKMLLKHVSAKNVYDIIESYVFKEEMFSNSKFSLSSVIADFSRADVVELSQFEDIFNSVVFDKKDAAAFITSIKPHVSIEYLFASYMYNGSCKEELKTRIKPLLFKDLEKYLYELKEILLVHVLHPQLQEKLKTSETYTFSNVNEIINDTSPLVQVFFKPEIWTKKGLSTPTSSGSINFAGFTAEDIELVREYGTIVGTVWDEEKFYSFIKSDIMKLDFIPLLQPAKLSDKALTTIIKFETTKEHAAGSYSSIDSGTVNNYLVDHVIYSYNKGKKKEIKPYTL